MIYIHVCISVCMYVFLYVVLFVCMPFCTSFCLHVCIFVCHEKWIDTCRHFCVQNSSHVSMSQLQQSVSCRTGGSFEKFSFYEGLNSVVCNWTCHYMFMFKFVIKLFKSVNTVYSSVIFLNINTGNMLWVSQGRFLLILLKQLLSVRPSQLSGSFNVCIHCSTVFIGAFQTEVGLPLSVRTTLVLQRILHIRIYTYNLNTFACLNISCTIECGIDWWKGIYLVKVGWFSVADPGFPVGGVWTS